MDILLALLAVTVVPIVINKSTEKGRFDFIHPYLREIWMVLLVFFTWYILDKPNVKELAMKHRYGWVGYLIAFLVGGILLSFYWAVTGWALRIQESTKVPSLVFIFGAPLGDNASATWMMIPKHYGPESAHNCTISFYDKDRKNLEHLWLVNHGSPPFLPHGEFDQSQQVIQISEANPDGVILGAFQWSPLNPNSQHYDISISCRDGVFIEKWEVARVGGILRSSLVIEHGAAWVRQNPNCDPVIFRCVDPEFVGTPLATEIPKITKKVVHPGWKPNYPVEVPMAIIDPNGNLQIASAIGGRTDFGCWNILMKHFGDNPRPQPQ
jgi:hypothetical protein